MNSVLLRFGLTCSGIFSMMVVVSGAHLSTTKKHDTKDESSSEQLCQGTISFEEFCGKAAILIGDQLVSPRSPAIQKMMEQTALIMLEDERIEAERARLAGPKKAQEPIFQPQEPQSAVVRAPLAEPCFLALMRERLQPRGAVVAFP